MDFKTRVLPASGLSGAVTDALLLVVHGNRVPADLPQPLADVLATAAKAGDFAFKPAQVFYAHQVAGIKAARVVFVGAGDGSAKAFRKAISAAVGQLKNSGAKQLLVASVGENTLSAAHAQGLVAAAADALYVYRATKPSAPAVAALASFDLVCDKAETATLAAALKQGQAVAAGVALARECANRPGNHCTPSYLADQARKLGKDHGLKVQVLERKDCEKLGMGSFLCVAQGSDEAPKFIVAQWLGGPKGQAPVVLVGKGITFDTGGISIKPAGEMDEMKFDMGGAASVLGTLLAVAQMKAKVNVVGVIPACENMPSGRAVKPGDVVTSMSGQTIEVLNTDAEGRLILCDALTYAERFKPAAVIDIATLTGACVIALGHHRTGLFSTNDALAAELLAAGDEAQDPAWRMPLDDEYDEALKSNFADMGNVGGRAGGAITAAMFLKRFTSRLTWAHLDIAGTAWKSGAAKGATGRPVALLTQFVLSRAR
jgi:leucyl aminopeptidase